MTALMSSRSDSVTGVVMIVLMVSNVSESVELRSKHPTLAYNAYPYLQPPKPTETYIQQSAWWGLCKVLYDFRTERG
jgi:hypothetical protein